MYSAKVLLTVSKARKQWRGVTAQHQRLLALDNRMEMKFFVNETTWMQRLRFYFIKNHRTSFRFRLFNFLVKIISVLLYIIRASFDDPKYTDCCGLCPRNWTADSNPTWKSQYDFSWTPILWVNRELPVWSIQVVLAVISFMYTILLTLLQYRGNLKQLVLTTDMFLELLCTLPFLATLAWPAWEPLRCLFVPVFLNVWLASSGLSNIMNDLQRATHRQKSALFNQMCLLFATLISLILTCICGVQHLERGGKNRMDMFDAMWFVVVTFSTVGYGDITPTIWPSKVVVIITICVALAVLPSQIEQLATLWADKQKEGSEYSRQRANTEKHVVVCATAMRMDIIMEFLNEFYAHPKYQNYIVVLLSPNELEGPLRLFLQVPIWAERVTYIKGSVLYDEDLHRVKLDAAEACFILTSRLEMNRKTADEKTILRSMACRNYAPFCPLYIQVLRPETKSHIQFADQIICDEEFKYALLSMNCYIPAISTVVTLLAHTSKGEDGNRHPVQWKRNFSQSAGNEIYSVTAENSKFFGECVGLKFPHAAQVVHARCGASLLGIKRNGKIQINPGLNCILQPTDLLFYICLTSEEDAIIINSSSLKTKNLNQSSYTVIEEKNKTNDNKQNSPIKLKEEQKKRPESIDELEDEANLFPPGSNEVTSEEDCNETIIKGFPSYFSTVAHSASYVPTICHILREPKKHCCMRLDRPCVHSHYNNAGQYKWKKPPIIVCVEMSCDSLTNIMIPLRAHYRPVDSLHPVVFLLENGPEEIFIESISSFPDVYYLIGHMDDLDSLLKAGTMSAHGVIVLDRETSMYAEEEYMADSRQLVTLQKLNKFFPGVHVCLELTHATNQRFMTKDMPGIRRIHDHAYKKTQEIEASSSLPYLFQQSFAGGTAFSSCMLDTLLYQSLVKEDITTLLRLMLGLQYSYGSGYLDTHVVLERQSGYLYSELFKEISYRRGGTLLGIFRHEKHDTLKQFLNSDDDGDTKKMDGIFNRKRRSSLTNTIKRSLKTKFANKASKKGNMSLRKLQALHCGMTERESLDEIIKNRMTTLGIPMPKVEDDSKCSIHHDEDEFGYVMLNPPPDTMLIKGDIIYLLMPEVPTKPAKFSQSFDSNEFDSQSSHTTEVAVL